MHAQARRFRCVLLVAAALSGFTSLPRLLQAQSRHDVRVMMDDSVSLDATYFLPPGVDSAAPASVPTIVFVHGFAMNKDETIPSARVYATMGFVTFTYSVRGHGNSGGRSSIMGWRERNDLAQIIAYVRSLPQVDAQKVGLAGGSQGGLHALWAAADHLPLKALSADVIGPHWASDMLANGAYRTTLCYLLSAYTVRYDSATMAPLREDLWEDRYDAFVQRFVPDRDIDDGEFSRSRTPMMLFGKWQDHYFRANEGILAYDLYRARRDFQKLYIGTGGHYSDDVQQEWGYQFGWITRWFQQLLRGEANGILEEPDVTYALSSLPCDTNGYFSWQRRPETGWPPAGIASARFHLRADGRLSAGAAAGAPDDGLELLNDYRDPWYTCYWAFWDDFQGEWFDSSFHQQSLVFTSKLLRSDVDWIGVPKLSFRLRSDAGKYPVNVQIYEVDREGEKHFINRINYVGRGVTPGQVHTANADGNAHAHTFRAGNRIRVEVTNLDMTNRKLLGWYPFVVPVFERSTTWIGMNASEPSYVELPLRWDRPLDSLFVDSTDVVSVTPSGDPALPQAFALYQNYPNPFNPLTRIDYALPRAGHVQLVLLNLLGEKVATLVDEVQDAGDRSVAFDAGALPSGVYFYRLQAGAFVDVKRMLLVR